MTFTNKEIIILYEALSNPHAFLLNELRGAKFLYAIDKNLAQLENEVKSLNKASKASERYNEYDKEKRKINEEFSLKDDNGVPKTKMNEHKQRVFVIDPARKDEYNERMKSLEEEYDEDITQREKELEDYMRYLDEENDSFKAHLINPEDVPENIKWEQYKVIRKLINKVEE